jgi:hypothetical protein
MSSALIARVDRTIWIIEPSAEGIFLFQFGPTGFVVDTWHPNVEEAKAQAAYSAGAIVGPWKLIPSDVQDLQTYGLAQARNSN